MKAKPYNPKKLPCKSLNWEAYLPLIGPAHDSLSKYDGILEGIPNTSIFLSPLTTQEAVVSSKIEGTVSTLAEVLEYEANPIQSERTKDIMEIINYRTAMQVASEHLIKKPLSLNLLREMHKYLLHNVRGQDKGAGFFRTTQNWIGKSPTTPIEKARYILPAPLFLAEHLDNFEKYIHFDEKDRLVQLAIIHAQFEIIHPFNDGNGRIGRILIPLFLFEKGLLSSPMFYISAYLEKNKEEYQDRLLAITETGNWDGWIIYFLNALINQARDNIQRVKDVQILYEEMKKTITEITHSQFSINALDALFSRPIFSTTQFISESKIPKMSSIRILKRLTGPVLKIAKEGKGKRPTIYYFSSLINLTNQ